MAAEEPDVRTLEVRGWLLRASEDLRAGKHDMTASPPLLSDVAFHAQQCAEKAMKAYLVHREQPFRKTHNLTELSAERSRGSSLRLKNSCARRRS
jgi:HEPN domain-containing protein